MKTAPGPVVAIIGGGFSGVMVAVQLLKLGSAASIIVFDAFGVFAKGLAYQTECDAHLLNVPAGAMSAFPDDPEHFLRWVRAKNPRILAEDFVSRKRYGEYLADVFAQARSHSSSSLLETISSRVVDVNLELKSRQFVCELENGSKLRADVVVLALGNFVPTMPDLGPQRFNPWDPKSLDGIEKLDSLLVVGSGLTAIDVLLAAESRGFGGEMHLISRRGLLPAVHTAGLPSLALRQLPNLRTPLVQRIASVRQEILADSSTGGNWRMVLDAMRPVVQDLWTSLAEKDRRRFLEHLRPYWDVHRHRLAPEIGERIERWKRSGKFYLHAGRILNIATEAEGAKVSWRPRGTRNTIDLRVGRVIHATGPEADLRKTADPLVGNLLRRGSVRLDDRGLGFDTNANGEVIDHEGHLQSGLFTLGPLRKGQLWESTAVRELRLQAQDLARKITARLCAPADVVL